jgi:hypothetical protein
MIGRLDPLGALIVANAVGGFAGARAESGRKQAMRQRQASKSVVNHPVAPRSDHSTLTGES